MFNTRRWGSAKACGWLGLWTCVASDQWQDRCAQRCSSAQLRRGIERERFKQRQRNSAAQLGNAVRCHALTGFFGLWRRLGQAHQLGAFGAHLGCGNWLSGLLDRYRLRKCRFLAQQAEQCSSEQQQRKPALHDIQRIAARSAKVNSSIKPWRLQHGPSYWLRSMIIKFQRRFYRQAWNQDKIGRTRVIARQEQQGGMTKFSGPIAGLNSLP